MIKSIQHFSFTVSNLEKVIPFFRDMLGLEVTPIREIKGERISRIVQMPSAVLRICNVIAPDNGNIELIEYISPAGEEIDLKTCNAGVGHVAFMVDNIQTMYQELTAKGVKFNSEPLWPPPGSGSGRAVCYLKGPDNLTFELMQDIQ